MRVTRILLFVMHVFGLMVGGCGLVAMCSLLSLSADSPVRVLFRQVSPHETFVLVGTKDGVVQLDRQTIRRTVVVSNVLRRNSQTEFVPLFRIGIQNYDALLIYRTISLDGDDNGKPAQECISIETHAAIITSIGVLLALLPLSVTLGRSALHQIYSRTIVRSINFIDYPRARRRSGFDVVQPKSRKGDMPTRSGPSTGTATKPRSGSGP